VLRTHSWAARSVSRKRNGPASFRTGDSPVAVRRVVSVRVPTRECENEDQIIPYIADLGTERVVIDSWNDLTKGWCTTSPQAAPRRLAKPANAGDGERKQDNRGGTYRVRLLRRKVQRDIDR
jgi:hypothetical protein